MSSPHGMWASQLVSGNEKQIEKKQTFVIVHLRSYRINPQKLHVIQGLKSKNYMAYYTFYVIQKFRVT